MGKSSGGSRGCQPIGPPKSACARTITLRKRPSLTPILFFVFRRIIRYYPTGKGPSQRGGCLEVGTGSMFPYTGGLECYVSPSHPLILSSGLA